jgi:LPXTG-motif cell wall-anchored protein
LRSFSVSGTQIQLTVWVLNFCGTGVPPPADELHVPIPALGAGEYQVAIEIQGEPSLFAQNLPLIVTGTVASPIPALGSKGLLALGGLLLIAGAVLLQRRRRRHQAASV